MKKTLCALVAVLAFSMPAAAADAWKYTQERCGFTLRSDEDRTFKKVEYTFRKNTGLVKVSLRAKDKDNIEITAVDNNNKYKIQEINNRTAMERCSTSMYITGCSKEQIKSAQRLVEEHTTEVDKYKKKWKEDNPGRCTIMGGW
ncbi:hypothetical protein ACFL96_07470 [Thermoproteota archaeon]